MGNPSLVVPFTTPVATWLATAIGDGTFAELYSTLKFDRTTNEDGTPAVPVPASGIDSNAGMLWANDVDDHVRAVREVFQGSRSIQSLRLQSIDGDFTSTIDWMAGPDPTPVRRFQLLFDGSAPELAIRSYSAAGAFVRNALNIMADDAASPNLVYASRDIQGRRLLTGLGTALTSGMITLGAGWGVGASVAVTAGSTAQRGRITVTAAGTPAANPTVSIATPDGVFPAGAIGSIRANGGSGASLTVFWTQPSSTPWVWTISGTPVAALTYSYDYGIFG